MEQMLYFQNQGCRLAATLHTPTQNPAPGVVICHGATGYRGGLGYLFVKAARAFCQAGFYVLRFDFRGCNDSEGDLQAMAVSDEIADATAAVAFLKAQAGVDGTRLALLGHSLGGLVAACTAPRLAEVKTLVLWAAVADLLEMIGQTFAGMDLETAQKQGYIDYHGCPVGSAFFAELPTIRPLQTVADFTGNALVVHGTDDQTVPLDHARCYEQALARSNRRLVLIEGADHNFQSVPWQQQVIGLTRDWLVDKLAQEVSLC